MSWFKVFSLLSIGLSLTAGQRSTAKIARCRAQCLDRFTVVGSGKYCMEDSECWMCWDTCKMLYSNFEIWGHLCSAKQICFPGCQESCKFYHKHDLPVSDAELYPLRFMSIENLFDPLKDTIRFEWSYPKSESQTQPLVYVFAMYDALDSKWHQMEQTYFRNITIRRGLLKSSLRIHLAAYDTSGKIAEIEKPASEIPVGHDDSDFDEMSLRDEHYNHGKEHLHKKILESWSPVLKSLKFSIKNIGAVDALISWSKITEIVEKYELEWKLADHQIDSAGYLRSTNNMAVIPLWPNSIYQITLRAYISGSKKSIAQSQTLTVDTSLNVFGKHPLENDCTECVPIESLTILVCILTGIVLVAFFSYFIASEYSSKKQRTRKDIETAQSQMDLKENDKPLKPKLSVRKTLSAVSARLASEIGHARLHEK